MSNNNNNSNNDIIINGWQRSFNLKDFQDIIQGEANQSNGQDRLEQTSYLPYNPIITSVCSLIPNYASHQWQLTRNIFYICH